MTTPVRRSPKCHASPTYPRAKQRSDALINARRAARYKFAEDRIRKIVDGAPPLTTGAAGPASPRSFDRPGWTPPPGPGSDWPDPTHPREPDRSTPGTTKRPGSAPAPPLRRLACTTSRRGQCARPGRSALRHVRRAAVADRRRRGADDLPTASRPEVVAVSADPRRLAAYRRAARASSYRRARRRIRCTWIDAAGRCQTRAAAGSPLCLLHGPGPADETRPR